MKLILDTQILLWAVFWPEILPQKALRLIADDENDLYFSPANLWEVSIKSLLNRADFQVDSRILRRSLLNGGCKELVITGLHAIATGDLPMLHKDPFDRLLLAQAVTENISLLTCDVKIAEYPAPVIFVPR
jgi:PIN domain nuclease of toxin-antitoxin system